MFPKHPVTPDMTFQASCLESFHVLILWTDPFQRSNDWTQEYDSVCYETTVSDGFGG